MFMIKISKLNNKLTANNNRNDYLLKMEPEITERILHIGHFLSKLWRPKIFMNTTNTSTEASNRKLADTQIMM